MIRVIPRCSDCETDLIDEHPIWSCPKCDYARVYYEKDGVQCVKENSQTRYDEIISEYIDIMNEHGPNSNEAKSYMKKYINDEELFSLLETSTLVKIMFLTGELDDE
jgi:uncharacterized Zn finger protein (UPF0148 family)